MYPAGISVLVSFLPLFILNQKKRNRKYYLPRPPIHERGLTEYYFLNSSALPFENPMYCEQQPSGVGCFPLSLPRFCLLCQEYLHALLPCLHLFVCYFSSRASTLQKETVIASRKTPSSSLLSFKGKPSDRAACTCTLAVNWKSSTDGRKYPLNAKDTHKKYF